jgi:RNA polymerase sigma-70 factor, ECF subfamily
VSAAPIVLNGTTVSPDLDPNSVGDHLDRLFRAAWALTGNQHDAEDLVQDTYLKVLAKPRWLRNDDDLGYMLRALRNTFLTKRRDAARRIQESAMPEDGSMIPDDNAPDPQRMLEAREIYAAIASLPDDYRETLVAVDVAGLSYKEAAEALGAKEGTIMSRLSRARGRVAEIVSA